MSFTTAEKVDIRRYCGYGLYGTGTPLPASGYRFSTHYGTLEYKMNTLGAEEEAVVRTTYLANLATLEQAIFSTSSNLDTSQAAVWTHNKNELKDRSDLFNKVRRDLCGFIGIAAGPDLSSNGITVVV